MLEDMNNSLQKFKNLLGKNPWQSCIEDCVFVNDMFEIDSGEVILETLSNVYLKTTSKGILNCIFEISDLWYNQLESIIL